VRCLLHETLPLPVFIYIDTAGIIFGIICYLIAA
jgi:hypothetical protein